MKMCNCDRCKELQVRQSYLDKIENKEAKEYFEQFLEWVMELEMDNEVSDCIINGSFPSHGRIKININKQVQVKLTEYGIKVFKEHLHYYDIDSSFDFFVKDNVLTKYQMWELMNVFGPEMTIGNNNMCFDNNEIVILD